MKRKIVIGFFFAILIFIVAGICGVRTYGTPGQTMNGGITYGDCGIEVWGTPGHFCGDY